MRGQLERRERRGITFQPATTLVHVRSGHALWSPVTQICDVVDDVVIAEPGTQVIGRAQLDESHCATTTRDVTLAHVLAHVAVASQALRVARRIKQRRRDNDVTTT